MDSAEKLITENLDVWTSAAKAKSSAGRGSSNKRELYGIQKLRGLILDLAVRGLLVPQNSDDEPAPELLRKIAKESAQSIKAGKQKEGKPLPPIKTDELPHEIPNSWNYVRIGEISAIERGGSPRPIKSYITESADGLNWIKIGDTDQGGKYIRSTAEKIRPDGLKKTRMVYPGDFLLTNSMSFGRPYITLIEGCIHDGWLRISPPNSLNKDYLYHLLSSPFVHRFFKASAAGAVVQNLNSEKVRALPIPLPPLAEQHRIVAKVDELMALCDQLEQEQASSLDTHDTLVATLLGALTTATADAGQFAEAWQRIQANFDTLFTTESSIDQLKQTILQLAVMGKLVEQDPKDEPAKDLVAKIAKDQARAIKAKKMRKPKAIDPYDEDLPFAPPPNWGWSQLGLLVAAEDNAMCDGPFGSKLKTSHYIEDKGFAVIRLGNIGVGEFIWGKEGYITEAHFESLAGNHTKPGDLIVAGMAEPLVRCCEVPPELGPAVNKADCFRVRLHSKMDRAYVAHYLNSPVAKSLAGEENHGMTRQRINLGNGKALPIPVPPLAEQHRIVAKVDELMALSDRLKASLATAQETQLNLADSLIEQVIVKTIFT